MLVTRSPPPLVKLNSRGGVRSSVACCVAAAGDAVYVSYSTPDREDGMSLQSTFLLIEYTILCY